MFYNNDIPKILSIIAFTAITLAVLIINSTGPASGYEISIYSAYPVYFWILIVTSTLCGITILVSQAFNEKRSDLWILGLMVLFLTDFIILSLPLFRDYLVFGRGDVLTHIGFAKDILYTGHFQIAGTLEENLYPILHVLMVNFNYLADINFYSSSMVIPLIFYMFFILSMYLLAREITKDHGKTVLITAFASILTFGSESLMLAPSVEGFFLIPLVIFLFYKTNTSETKIAEYILLLIVLLILIPFFHPGEVTFFLLLILVLISFSSHLYRRICKNYSLTDRVPSIRKSSSVLLLLIVVWVAWFTSFSVFLGKIKLVRDWLFYEVGTTNAMQYGSILSSANLSFYNFAFILMKMYGPYLMFFVLSAVICMVLLKKMLSSGRCKVNLKEFTFFILFSVFGVTILLSFTNFIGVDFGRVLKYELLISIFLNGAFLYSYFSKKELKKKGMILITCFLLISGTIGIFNIYPSPLTRNPNSQVTAMELTGSNWFLDNWDKKLYMDDNANFYYGQIFRFTNGVKSANYPDISVGKVLEGPDHFNYKNKSLYGQTYDSDFYYINMKLLRISYPSIYPEYRSKWRFTTQDFYRLDNNDTSVNSIYSNGEFWIYYVKSQV